MAETLAGDRVARMEGSPGDALWRSYALELKQPCSGYAHGDASKTGGTTQAIHGSVCLCGIACFAPARRGIRTIGAVCFLGVGGG